MSESETDSLYSKILERPIERVIKSCNVAYLPPKGEKGRRFLVYLLNGSYSLDIDKREVIDLNSEEPADSKTARLIAKYIALCESPPKKEEWVLIDRFQGGAQIGGEMSRRAIRPLLDAFGYDAAGFESACRIIGGKKEKLGGVSYSFEFFPRFRILIQLWPAELSSYREPTANFMFGSSATKFFTASDIVDASEIIVSAIIKGRQRRLTR